MNERQIEYFWELHYLFGKDLMRIFGEDKYKRLYSLIGDGIFNLLIIDGKIFDVQIKEHKGAFPQENNVMTRDKIKNDIFNKLKLEYAGSVIKDQTLYIPIQGYIAKISIVKKMAMPQ